jgi:hypothetical protein
MNALAATLAQFLWAIVLIGTPVLVWAVLDLIRYERKHRTFPLTRDTDEGT